MSEDPAKRTIRFEMIIAIMALIISLCALALSAVETRILSAQQRAAVWPYVAFSAFFGPDGFGFRVQNNGVGPARVTGVSVTVDGTPVKQWQDWIDRALGPGSGVGYNLYRTQVLNGIVMPAQSTMEVFGVPWTEETRTLSEGVSGLDVTICYCSVFDECWVAKPGNDVREGACPIPDAAQFSN